MMLFSLSNDTNYMVKGELQTTCTTDKEVRKSFIKEDFPKISEKLMFLLKEGAQLTDCLSPGNISASGFLINDKLKELFEGFKLMDHKYYDAVVIDRKGNEHNYYWMQLKQNLTHCIDFENSEFVEMNITQEVGPITLHSFDEYSQKRSKLGWEWDVKTKKLVIKQNTQIEKMDMFNLFPFTSRIYISENLKDAIHNSSLTGLVAKENQVLVMNG